jgi:hypothetical protein
MVLQVSIDRLHDSDESAREDSILAALQIGREVVASSKKNHRWRDIDISVPAIEVIDRIRRKGTKLDSPSGYIKKAFEYSVLEQKLQAPLVGPASKTQLAAWARARGREQCLDVCHLCDDPVDSPLDYARHLAKYHFAGSRGRILAPNGFDYTESELAEFIASGKAKDLFGWTHRPIRRGPPEFFSVEEDRDSRDTPPDYSSDLLDAILAQCSSDFEREVVKLRIDGLTDKQIAKRLGVSHSTVWRWAGRLTRACIESGVIQPALPKADDAVTDNQLTLGA